MHICVLGAAAGGGFPQWNCNCTQCRCVRDGSRPARRRTQASLAVSADSARWLLVNASPDIRSQIDAFAPLQPRGERLRGTPIGAVLLTNADVDHVCGLLSLREFQALSIYATPQVQRWVVDGNCMFNVLKAVPGQAEWRPITIGAAQPVVYQHDAPSGLRYEALAVPSKVPGYLGAIGPGFAETIALKLSDEHGAQLAYVPGIKEVDATLIEFLQGARVIFFDGTFWADDEMPQLGLTGKTALTLGHIPMAGPRGSMHALDAVRGARKIYTHINNTNPVLLEDSPQHQEVCAAGWELAYDGLEIRL